MVLIILNLRDERMTFELSRGALLVLKDSPVKVSIPSSIRLTKYIEANQDDWYESLADRDDCPAFIFEETRLVLVTAIHRSHDWALGAWSKLPGSVTFSYVRNSSGGQGRWHPSTPTGVKDGPVNYRVSHPPIHPLPDRQLGDQTLFIEGYRIGHRARHKPLRDLFGHVVPSSSDSNGWFHKFWNTLLGGYSSGSSYNSTPSRPAYPLAPPSTGASQASDAMEAATSTLSQDTPGDATLVCLC
jgi:hypothetical protein